MAELLSQGLEYRKEKFSRAAATYHAASAMQKRVAEHLGTFLEDIHLDNEGTGLEIACGTGHLTEQLLQKYPKLQWIISDVSESMLHSCESRLLQEEVYSNSHNHVQWRLLDGMNFKTTHQQSLIASSAIVQWLKPLREHLECVWHALEPNGYYVFSGFCVENFPELRSILKKPPFASVLDVGYTEEEVASALQDVGFIRCTWFQETLEAEYPSLHQFLKTIQDFGGAGNPQVRMTPQKMRFLEQEYTTRFSTENGVVATWRPWYVVAQKVAG
jgi:malonyl-CoA O-methyltransferase